MDVTFGDALAPRQGQPGFHRDQVILQPPAGVNIVQGLNVTPELDAVCVGHWDVRTNRRNVAALMGSLRLVASLALTVPPRAMPVTCRTETS